MPSLTTIQITKEEDAEIGFLKEKLALPSKKAVVMEGLNALREILRNQQRRRRLQASSQMVRKESGRINRDWAGLSTALRVK